MKEEMRENKRENSLTNHPAANQSADRTRSIPGEEPLRRGPFTFTAGWLGTAFNRTQIDKREAEERRSRNM